MQKPEFFFHLVEQSAASATPFARFLSQNYFNPAEQLLRYQELIQSHKSHTGDVPMAILRAPGRIEVLGGHTDYNGCPVIAMAIDRDILGAVSPRTDSKICVQNVKPQFLAREFAIAKQIPPYPTGDWGNYIKAAIEGIIADLIEKSQTIENLTGFNLTISGNIPDGAGLSSSSALVVLSAIVFQYINSLQYDKLALAQLLAKAEKYVGTQGGGMDQTISLVGEFNKALKIDFNPYSTQLIHLPDKFNILVAHSLVHAPKTQSAMDKYNRRAIECRLALAVIKKVLEQKLKRSLSIKLIGDLTPEKTGIPTDQLFNLASGSLTEKIYYYKSLSQILEIPIPEVQKRYCLRRDLTVFPEPADGFQLYNRFYHIFTEWHRVINARAVLERGNLIEFGKIMNQSHQSARDYYELSTPEVNFLADLSLKYGALGCRLTGAGFGGCIISLVAPDLTESFISGIEKEYYKQFAANKLANPDDWKKYLFVCKSVQGAGVVLD
ncbi:galactokinase [candidate division KSB1 bacterium]|nr:galactokinase [candidate division KSB1 bacterium]